MNLSASELNLLQLGKYLRGMSILLMTDFTTDSISLFLLITTS